MWGFPKIRGTVLRIPIKRSIVCSGLYRGSLFLGNYHVGFGVTAWGCSWRKSCTNQNGQTEG